MPTGTEVQDAEIIDAIQGGASGKDPDSIVSRAWDMVMQWLKYRDQKVDTQRWRWYYAAFCGKFWPDSDDTDEVRAYVNSIFSEVQLRIAVFNTQKPTAIFQSYDEEDVGVEEIQKDWDATWEDSGYSYKRLLVSKNVEIMSTGIGKVTGGPRLAAREAQVNAFGDVVASRSKVGLEGINPLEFVIAPGATEIQDAYGCAQVSNVHVTEAKRQAREWAKAPLNEIQVNPDHVGPGIINGFEDLANLRKSRGGEERAVNFDSAPTRFYYPGSGPNYGPNDQTTVAEVYYRENDDIRLIVVAGQTLVYYGPAPIPRVFPFALYKSIADDLSPWGVALPAVFETQLDWESKIWSLALEAAIDEATAFVVVDAGTDVDLQSMRSGRGVNVLTVSPTAREPRIGTTGKVPQGLFQMMNALPQVRKDIIGDTQVLRGGNPTGVTSGEQLNMLLDTATTFLRPEIQSMEHGDEQLARIWAHAAGHADKLKRIFIEPGSSAGFRKAREASTIMQLAQMPGMLGPLDMARRTILRVLQVRGWEKLVKEIEAAQQQAQAAMAQVQTGALPSMNGQAPAGLNAPAQPPGPQPEPNFKEL